MRFKVFKPRVLLMRLMFVRAEFQVFNYPERLWISDGVFGRSRVKSHGILRFRGNGIARGREHGQHIRSARNMSHREGLKIWWGWG